MLGSGLHSSKGASNDRTDRQAALAAETLGETVYTQFPFHEGAKPVDAEGLVELALNRTWRPQLSV